MKVEIKSWQSGAILFSLETESMKLCVEAAVRSGADLSGADLLGADLSGAYLSGATGVTPKVLHICGSRHPLIVREYGCVGIGCYHFPLEKWEADYAAIGASEGYSEAEIEEYREHIAHARRFMERYQLLKAPGR